MKLPFQSIRWRIQVWHGIILLMAISAFCATAYQLAWINQSRRLDREVERHERQLIKALSDQIINTTVATDNLTSPRGPQFEALFEILSRGKIPSLENIPADFSGKSSGYYYYAFAGKNGEIILKSDNAPSHLEFLPIPAKGGMHSIFRDSATFRERALSFDFGLRIIIGRDISTELAEYHQLGWSLGISSLALWLAGLIGGWWLAGKAIRPIQTISQTATRIAQGNLDERISTSNRDSELDQLSHVLNHTFDRISTTLEQQRQFTADASHELRTPLTIILSESQRMRKREIPRRAEDYQESFDLCHTAATRMKKLVENLLLLARQDSDSEGSPESDCDLATLINDSVTLLTPLANSKHIAITTEVPSSPYRSNPDLLIIVFNNLIGNAVQHHPGPGTVQIKVEQTGSEYRLRIRDDGPGIPSEDLPHIFERFYQVDSSRKSSQEGHSGLGLALAKTIIENRGGRIEVKSEWHHGCEFIITLPLSFPSG